jgi:hypothetical protein
VTFSISFCFSLTFPLLQVTKRNIKEFFSSSACGHHHFLSPSNIFFFSSFLNLWSWYDLMFVQYHHNDKKKYKHCDVKFNNVTKNLLIITPHCYHLCKWTSWKKCWLRIKVFTVITSCHPAIYFFFFFIFKFVKLIWFDVCSISSQW